MEQEQRKSSLDSQVQYVARWMLAVSLFVGGFSQVGDSGASALLLSLSGILICPPVVDRINEKLKGKFGFAAQFGTVIGAFVLMVAYSPSTPKEETFTAEQVQQIVDETLSEQEKELEEIQIGTTPTEEVTEEPEKSEAMKDVEREISSKEAEVSKIQGWIETFDCPFDEYQRINDMYFAAGNMNANKDQFFINVWQGEINELESEITDLNSELKTIQ